MNCMSSSEKSLADFQMSLTAILIHLLFTVPITTAYPFSDVSVSAGLERPFGPQIKYGDAVVADLNGDGHADLLYSHHNARFSELYFGHNDGTFSKSDWRLHRDIHGINPFRVQTSQEGMHLTLSQGGANGGNPVAPAIFRVHSNQTVQDVTADLDMDTPYAKGRGRSAVYMSLRPGPSRFPDVIYMNAKPRNASEETHTFFETLSNGRFRPRENPELSPSGNRYGTVTNMDGDASVELLTFHELNVHKVTDDFKFSDISTNVLPRGRQFAGTIAVAELDFDNDGHWDLYIARMSKGSLSWLERKYREPRDYLLRNVGGRYVDESERAGIPRKGHSSGVTVGDFNNDGWVDIIVTRFHEADLILLNNGDGTFERRDAGFDRAASVNGNMATAVDYDRDGRVDVVVSEGDWHDETKGGFVRLLRNVGSHGNYVLIRVGNSPNGTAVSLHAIVRANVNGRVMMRRVGSVGTAVSNSYIETVHFGIAEASSVDSVSVTWSDGSVQVMADIAANSFTVFGS